MGRSKHTMTIEFEVEDGDEYTEIYNQLQSIVTIVDEEQEDL